MGDNPTVVMLDQLMRLLLMEALRAFVWVLFLAPLCWLLAARLRK